MNVLASEEQVLELQRRLAQSSAPWGLPSATSASGSKDAEHQPPLLPLSPDSGSEAEADPEPAQPNYPPTLQGLSPVPSGTALDAPPPSRGGYHCVAVFCQLVGGGLGGAVDLCASVSLVDECGHVLLDTLVKPSIPVTDYRHATTGLTASMVGQGMPFRKARKLVLGILRGREGTPPRGGASPLCVPVCPSLEGRQVLLVGVHMQRTLSCLMLDHPEDCLRELEADAAVEIPADAGQESASNDARHLANAEVAARLLKFYMEG